MSNSDKSSHPQNSKQTDGMTKVVGNYAIGTISTYFTPKNLTFNTLFTQESHWAKEHLEKSKWGLTC